MKFYYNGIRTSDGKLHKGDFYLNEFGGTIHFSADGYRSLPKEVAESFKILNESDIMSDYHDRDKFVIQPSHELYKQALEAAIAGERKMIGRLERRKAKESSYGLENLVARIRVCEARINHMRTYLPMGAK